MGHANSKPLEHDKRHKHKRTTSLYAALVVERDRNYDFESIYEVLDLIGQGGLCNIFKIRKKEDHIGGSSRPELVRRRSLASPLVRGKSATLVRSVTVDGSSPAGSSTTSKPLYYALKVINLALIKEDKIGQLRQEVEILKTLDHRSIIKAYETFQMKASKKLMIVMELCTGGDLFARMPYTELQAARVMGQVLSAVSYLHENNIIHRDIKMENIMFESEHPQQVAIKLIDFGLSKKYSLNDHILTERVGTLYSMSPETMQGTYTYSADLWSIGVCTYMLLAEGAKPFDGKTPKEVIAKVLLGRYSFDDPLWQNVSPKAKAFISALLVVKPSGRASAVQAMSHPWILESSNVSNVEGVDEEFKQKVRESIIRYADTGEFRKLALNVVAKKSTSAEILKLRQVFDEFDTLNSGTLTMPEFKAALSQFNYSEEDITKIFRKVDINRNNVINYTEFLAAALETQGVIEEYRLAEAFDLMDTDDSGYISRENLRQILGQNSNEKYIDRLIAEADFKKDGRISYEEFLQVFAREQKKLVSGIYGNDDLLNDASTHTADEILHRHGIRSKIFLKGFGSRKDFDESKDRKYTA